MALTLNLTLTLTVIGLPFEVAGNCNATEIGIGMIVRVHRYTAREGMGEVVDEFKVDSKDTTCQRGRYEGSTPETDQLHTHATWVVATVGAVRGALDGVELAVRYQHTQAGEKAY